MGKSRKHFDKWYRNHERGLAAGLQDMRLIAQSSFNEGVKFAGLHHSKKPCVNCDFYKTNVRFNFCPDCGRSLT